MSYLRRKQGPGTWPALCSSSDAIARLRPRRERARGCGLVPVRTACRAGELASAAMLCALLWRWHGRMSRVRGAGAGRAWRGRGRAGAVDAEVSTGGPAALSPSQADVLAAVASCSARAARERPRGDVLLSGRLLSPLPAEAGRLCSWRVTAAGSGRRAATASDPVAAQAIPAASALARTPARLASRLAGVWRGGLAASAPPRRVGKRVYGVGHAAPPRLGRLQKNAAGTSRTRYPSGLG